MINKELKKYIEDIILPKYKENDKGHGIDHINYVIKRSFNFAKQVEDINLDMVFTIAAYHDIGHSIDPKKHEEISAKMLFEDQELGNFFTEEEIRIMSEAVNDHRASLEYEPRSIYGKIVSSADRNTDLDAPFRRTYEYRKANSNDLSIKEIMDESYKHLVQKFGKKGYATEKMYFEDQDYKKFLEDLNRILENRQEFDKKFIEVNGLEKVIKEDDNIFKGTFAKIKDTNPEYSLDQILYAVYNAVKTGDESFDILRPLILDEVGIDEIEYYTRDVIPELKEYVERDIFPLYAINDQAHGIVHIMEVIRRSFALNDTFKLNLNHNMIYAIAAYHDLGKHENHEIHEMIAGEKFFNDQKMKDFFTDEERLIIRQAIEDHRSSKEDEPRSVYGKLISSADRNTRIEIVFIRSFFVAKERMPEENIEDYLDYTIKRLSKKYSEDNPENMFFEDETYKVFLADMRKLLKNEDEFKKRYCEVNHIKSRSNKVKDEQGEIAYTKSLRLSN